jgi:hypothetical protein
VRYVPPLALVVGVLAGACSSSGSPAMSSAPGATATTPAFTSSWSKVNLETGAVTRVTASKATSGPFYVVSPDHKKVAYNPCCDWKTPAFLANVDGTDVQELTAGGLDGVGEAWSPDGSQVVYQQRDGSGDALGGLFLQNVATGQRTRVTNLGPKQWGWWFTFPSFSSDGKSVLYQLPKGPLPNGDNRNWNLWSVPVTGGKPTLVQRNAGWGGYSPNGRWLAYLSPVRHDFSGGGLWIARLHGGTPRALVRGGSLLWPRWSPNGAQIAYVDGSYVYVADVATGSTRKVARGAQPEWLNSHTLIVSGG